MRYASLLRLNHLSAHVAFAYFVAVTYIVLIIGATSNFHKSAYFHIIDLFIVTRLTCKFVKNTKENFLQINCSSALFRASSDCACVS